jgi:hypothetical protein
LKEDNFTFVGHRANCKRIGESHDYEVIDVQRVNPYHVDLMITTMPRNAIGSYSTVTYECHKCLETRMMDMPTEIAEREQDNGEKGKVSTTQM